MLHSRRDISQGPRRTAVAAAAAVAVAADAGAAVVAVDGNDVATGTQASVLHG